MNKRDATLSISNTEDLAEVINDIHHYLNKHKEYLNSLNVFPVPDGDTGLNMVLTLQGAMANMTGKVSLEKSAGEYLKEFAEHMLLNSRGCSGVILSLFVQGFANVVSNNNFSKENIYKAIENGYRNAYEGTKNPQEGTMLTLMLSLIHISEPTRLLSISYAVFCLKKKKNKHNQCLKKRGSGTTDNCEQ